MRSRRDYIVTKDEVYSYANDWLSAALRLEYEGSKCTASTLFQVLLIAAARVVSIFAACRDLADAPSDQTIRNALAASLPEIAELERRLNRALVTKLPKALRRKAPECQVDELFPGGRARADLSLPRSKQAFSWQNFFLLTDKALKIAERFPIQAAGDRRRGLVVLNGGVQVAGKSAK